MALGVVHDLLVGPPAGSLHPGRQPINHDRLAGSCHLHQQPAQVVEGGDEGAVGLAEAEGAQRAEQQVQAVADLGLGDTDHAAGAPIRQPVQQHRGDRVQADLQRQRRGAAGAGRDGTRWATRAASQASTSAGSDERGQYDTGDRTSWQT
jgi:hypothetical protein